MLHFAFLKIMQPFVLNNFSFKRMIYSGVQVTRITLSAIFRTILDRGYFILYVHYTLFWASESVVQPIISQTYFYQSWPIYNEHPNNTFDPVLSWFSYSKQRYDLRYACVSNTLQTNPCAACKWIRRDKLIQLPSPLGSNQCPFTLEEIALSNVNLLNTSFSRMYTMLICRWIEQCSFVRSFVRSFGTRCETGVDNASNYKTQRPRRVVSSDKSV